MAFRFCRSILIATGISSVILSDRHRFVLGAMHNAGSTVATRGSGRSPPPKLTNQSPNLTNNVIRSAA